MKKFVFILIASLNLINVYGQSNSPNLKQIYDFQIGDVFNYKTTNVDYRGGYPSETTYYDRYEIANKIIKNDSIIYYKKHNDSNNLIEKVVYIDSINNILNKSNNEIVKYKNSYDTVFLKVRIVNETIPKKIIGGIGYNYKYNKGICDTTQVLNHDDLNTKFIYGQGLGLIEIDQSQFETGSSTVLIGYKKGNVTVGDLTAISQQKFDNEVQVYPNPFNNEFVIKYNMDESFNIDIFNQQGCLVKSLLGYKSLNQINGSNFKAGIYFLRLKGKNGYIYKSIMKD